MSKKTTIQIDNNVKDVLSSITMKGVSYSDMVNVILTKTLTDEEYLDKFLNNANHSVRACFYLGVLEDKVYADIADTKIWEDIKKLNHNNFKKVYRVFVDASFGEYDELKEKVSLELLASDDLSDLDDDGIKYYYTLGRCLSDNIQEDFKVRCSFGTTDSYSTSYPLTSIYRIIDYIKRKEFNFYQGGKVDSLSAFIKKSVPGYVTHDCIKLKFASESECREFESRIRYLFDEEMFNPRNYNVDY